MTHLYSDYERLYSTIMQLKMAVYICTATVREMAATSKEFQGTGIIAIRTSTQ